MNPRISVCMATHNGERFIEAQLASILAQLASDDEVIVSDDGSTDRTVEIVRGFADPRIRLLTGNSFSSPVLNFENALTSASGDIIVLSDQDDIWLPNKVAVIRELFSRKPQPVYLVVLDGEVIDASGNLLFPSLLGRLRRAGPGLLKNIVDNSYIGCSMAFSRPLLEIALPFPPRIPMHDMWLGLLAELFGSTSFVPSKTMQYRKHEASMTDFPIRFMPWTQLKRRWFLSWALLQRWLAMRHRIRG